MGGPAKKKIRPRTWALLGVLSVSALATAGLVGVPYARARRAAAGPALANPRKPPPALPERWTSLSRPGQIDMTDRVFAHVGSIFSVAISPDGKLVASGGSDGAVKIWNLETTQPVRALAGQTGKVRNVAWTPDGSAVISAGGNGVLVQDVKTGATRRALALPDGKAADWVAVSPDGKTIVATRNDGTIRGFNLETGAVLFDAQQPKGLFRIAMSPDGTTFATAQGGGTLGLWSLATGKLTSTREGHDGPVDDVAWAPDGRVLFSVGDDRSLKMWHMDRTDALRTASEATDEVWSVATEPRGKYVATVSKDGYLRLYDALNFKNTRSADVEYAVGGSREGVMTVQFAPDGTHLVTGDVRGYLAYFTLEVKSRPERVPVLPNNAPEDRVAKTPAHKVYAQSISMIDKAEGDQAVLDAAEAMVRKAIADDSKNALHHVALASLLRRTARHEKARGPHPLGPGGPELEKALELSPKLPEALLERAWVEHTNADDAGAKADALESEKLGGVSASAEMLLGELAFADHKLDEAEAHAVKAVSLSSRVQVGGAYDGLRKLYWQQGDDAAYVRAYELQIAAKPWSAWAKGNFASALLTMGDVDRAIEIGKQTVAQRNYGAARQTLADAYSEKGANELWSFGLVPEAKADFENALASMPTHALAHYGLGAYYRKAAVDSRDRQALARSTHEFDLASQSNPKLTLAKKALEDNALLEKTLSEPARKP